MPRRTDVRLRFLSVLLALVGLVCIAQQPQPARGQLGAPGCGATVGKLIYQPCAAIGFTPSCTASTNWLARATGVTLTADKQNYDNLLCGLNTDGVLAKLDALYIFAAVDQTTAKLNLVQNSFNGTTNGTINFSAYVGYTGDASTFYISTAFTGSTGGTNYTQNSASLGVYNRTANASENTVAIGSDASINAKLSLQPAGGVIACAINGGATNSNLSIVNDQGFLVCTRTSSSNIGASKNGTASLTQASTSSGLDNVITAIFCQNDGFGTFNGCTSDQFSGAFIGGSLTDPNIASLSSRMNTYMTAYGINVY